MASRPDSPEAVRGFASSSEVDQPFRQSATQVPSTITAGGVVRAGVWQEWPAAAFAKLCDSLQHHGVVLPFVASGARCVDGPSASGIRIFNS